MAEALAVEIRHRQRQEQLTHLQELHEYMRQKYGASSASAEDITTMRQEKDDEIASGS